MSNKSPLTEKQTSVLITALIFIAAVVALDFDFRLDRMYLPVRIFVVLMAFTGCLMTLNWALSRLQRSRPNWFEQAGRANQNDDGPEIEAARSRTAAFIEAAAAETAAAMKADQPSLLETYKTALAEDRTSYHFECRRFDDFLFVGIRRPACAREPRSYATAINLGRVRQIRLEEGRPPDMNGRLPFNEPRLIRETDGEEVQFGWNCTSEMPPGTRWVVPRPNQDDAGPRTLVTVGKDFAESIFLPRRRYNYDITTVVEGAARPAEDDKIIFVGADIRLHVPCGRGQEVHKAIMSALPKSAVRQD